MGLFDLLPTAKGEAAAPADEATVGRWSGALAAPTKRPGPAPQPPPALRAAGRGGGGTDVLAPAAAASTAGRGRGRGRGAGGDADVVAGLTDGSLRDEYDPARPSDYDEVVRARERARAAAEAEAERQERRREALEGEERQRQRDELAALEELDRRAAATAAAEDLPPDEDALVAGSGGDAQSLPRGMPAAERMMRRMGWVEGRGLGRSGRGIATPLQVRKTDARSGVVVAAEPLQAPEAAEPLHAHLPPVVGPPTRVLLLRNVVAAGGVEDSLEEEVGAECARHGAVADVAIFEATGPPQLLATAEAVRVFVAFEDAAAAARAAAELHGRLFGGRAVEASFFDEARFARGGLAPTAEEAAAAVAAGTGLQAP